MNEDAVAEVAAIHEVSVGLVAEEVDEEEIDEDADVGAEEDSPDSDPDSEQPVTNPRVAAPSSTGVVKRRIGIPLRR